MATYTYGQLEGLWVDAGGSAALAPIMAAIAMAESGGNSAAVGHNTNGSTDTGLWQINSVHNVSGMTDPEANAKEAVKIYKSQGLSAWTTYTSGAYKKFLKSGVSAVTTGLTGSTSNTNATDASLTGDVGNAIGQGFAQAFTAIFKPLIEIMVWGTETMLGGALMVVGFLIVVQNSQTGKKVETEVAKSAIEVAEPELAPEIQGVSAAKSAGGFPSFDKSEEVRSAKSPEDFRKIRNSGYTGKVRHDYK